jgi:pimeloyl-ACP methyl ester carboxylesterase
MSQMNIAYVVRPAKRKYDDCGSVPSGRSGAKVIAAHTPNARMHVFGECGHCPQYEEPEAFIAIIEDWLAANQ